MTKDDFVKQFRAQLYELALESFHQARMHHGKEVPVLKAHLAETMLDQMRTATELLGKMYDAMQPKAGGSNAPPERKPK